MEPWYLNIFGTYTTLLVWHFQMLSLMRQQVNNFWEWFKTASYSHTLNCYTSYYDILFIWDYYQHRISIKSTIKRNYTPRLCIYRLIDFLILVRCFNDIIVNCKTIKYLRLHLSLQCKVIKNRLRMRCSIYMDILKLES